jgi:hypothetical protein
MMDDWTFERRGEECLTAGQEKPPIVTRARRLESGSGLWLTVTSRGEKELSRMRGSHRVDARVYVRGDGDVPLLGAFGLNVVRIDFF